MKKLILMIIVSIIFVFSSTTYANNFELTVENKTAHPGETVTVNMDFSNNSGIIAALFKVEYDKQRLELIKADDKGLLRGAVFSKTYDAYPYIMLWNSSSAKNFIDDGVLAILTFKVLDTAKNGNAFIDISYHPDDVFDADLNNVDIHINNGAILVSNGEEEDIKSPENIENTEDTKDTEDAPVKTESPNNKTQSSASGSFHNSSSVTLAPNTTDIVAPPAANTFSFEDVKPQDWYYEAVTYAVKNNLMNGISETNFAPFSPLTRAMLVTVLYRNEGSPYMENGAVFEDVTGNMYFVDAVSWAQQNNIVNGISKTEFAPDLYITREQIATILYRYSVYKNYNTTAKLDADLCQYSDFDSVSEYATEAVQYAVGIGLMKGKTQSTINPLDNATRAETAALLQRFIAVK